MIELKDKTTHVEYENQPDIKRNLLQNIFELTQDQYEQLAAAIESIPEDYTQALADIQELKEQMLAVLADLANKANKTGVYPDLVSGSAEQIITDEGSEDRTPYLIRTVPYDSTKFNDEIVGVSVGWNQYMPETYKSGSKTFDADASYYGAFYSDLHLPITPNHIYFCAVKVTRNIATNDQIGIAVTSGSNTIISPKLDNGAPNGFAYAIKSSGEFNTITGILWNNYAGKTGFASGDSVSYDDLMLIDLTAWFGSAIADYANTLETATAGSGVAFIKALLPGGYIPDSAPTLKSIEGLSAHVMRDASDNIVGNYPLDSSLTLRGILKMDASHNVYADGDVYGSDGTVNRRYGVYTFTGNEVWIASQTEHRFSLNVSYYGVDVAVQPATEGALQNIVSSKYGQFVYTNADKIAYTYVSSGTIYIVINDSAASTVQEIANLWKDTTLVYELATPTTETADPYASPQNCAVGGTEEYVYAEGGSGVVVGHVSSYYANLTGKLVALPDPAEADGTYLIEQTSGRMSLTPYPPATTNQAPAVIRPDINKEGTQLDIEDQEIDLKPIYDNQAEEPEEQPEEAEETEELPETEEAEEQQEEAEETEEEPEEAEETEELPEAEEAEEPEEGE